MRFWFLYFQGQSAFRTNDPATPVPIASSAPASEAAAETPEKSIAVLAFADLSPQRDQDYFSDGIAEEILNALAQVKDLKVAGRTSSFYFKGKNEKLQTIGAALGVAHVLEGSVRKQGDKVRITAQLIRSKDGFHMWSETFDGDLEDVFALQERIAQSITDKLKVVLSGRQAQRLVSVGTENPEAYALYLQATGIFNRRDGPRYQEASRLLEQALALDPGFARAHARLAALNSIWSNYSSANFESSLRTVERHARLASALDPTLSEPYAALGQTLQLHRQYIASRKAFARALEIDADDATVNFWNGAALMVTGYSRQGRAALDRALVIDPMLPNALLWRGREFIYEGDLASADRLLQRAADGGLASVGMGTSHLALARGNSHAALEPLTQALKNFSSDFPPQAAGLFAAACLGDLQARPQALALIDAYVGTRPKVMPGVVPYVLLRSGEFARGFSLWGGQRGTNDALIASELFGHMTQARHSPGFPALARKMGWAELWDHAGPPDQCRKDTHGDYFCR